MIQLLKKIIEKKKSILVTFEYCEATDHRSCGRFVCFLGVKKLFNADAPKRSDVVEC